MSDKKILFISQEISPYLSETEMSKLGSLLPQKMQSRGYEVRTFMPKFGAVNERRNQLHEVIRLSGMNIIISDNDHPLILKVASMQPSRIQVYFIDNDDYFQKSAGDVDAFGSNRKDNDERAIFFARGTMETVKKLRWLPAIVHCEGWMTSLSPVYFKNLTGEGPSFRNTKFFYSVTADEMAENAGEELLVKLKADGLTPKEMKKFKVLEVNKNFFHKIAIEYCDGVIFHTEPDAELLEYVKAKELPYKVVTADTDPEEYAAFYESL